MTAPDRDRDQRLERLMDKFATGDRVTFEPLKLAADIRSLLREARELRAELDVARNAFRHIGQTNTWQAQAEAAEAQVARLREILTEWIPPHLASCCTPAPETGEFPLPIRPEWCRCPDRVKRARQALAAGEHCPDCGLTIARGTHPSSRCATPGEDKTNG